MNEENFDEVIITANAGCPICISRGHGNKEESWINILIANGETVPIKLRWRKTHD